MPNHTTTQTPTARRIGPRMAELCRILRAMGGFAPSQSAAYMELDYRGGSSNRFGHRVMERAQAAGLIAADYKAPGLAIPVTLTPLGHDVARG